MPSASAFIRSAPAAPGRFRCVTVTEHLDRSLLGKATSTRPFPPLQRMRGVRRVVNFLAPARSSRASRNPEQGCSPVLRRVVLRSYGKSRIGVL